MTGPFMWLLITGPGGARAATFNQPAIRFGRDPESDVVLYAPYVSRHHATLTCSGDEVILSDCGSKNGVALNGNRVVASTTVVSGDVISIGAFRITLMLPAPDEPTTQDLLSWQESLVVDRGSHSVRIGEHELEEALSMQEFNLLWLLYERAESVVTREDLGTAIWGPGNFDANMVHRLVRRVRLKIEPDPAAPRFVQTVPGVGYIVKNAHRGLERPGDR